MLQQAYHVHTHLSRESPECTKNSVKNAFNIFELSDSTDASQQKLNDDAENIVRCLLRLSHPILEHELLPRRFVDLGVDVIERLLYSRVKSPDVEA
jgi:hypothetical protein